MSDKEETRKAVTVQNPSAKYRDTGSDNIFADVTHMWDNFE
jgi:hypothetical protein